MLKNSISKSINFLDKPLWTPSRKLAKETVYEDISGYKISCDKGLPTSIDNDILNFLLFQQQRDDSKEITFKNMSKLLNGLEYSHNPRMYNYVLTALERWKNTKIVFNEFYFGNGVKSDYKLDYILDYKFDFKSLHITFNKKFLSVNKESNYKSRIYLPYFSTLTPFSKRLYEILSKSFLFKHKFYISNEILKKKMIMESLFLSKIKNALLEINTKATNLNLKMGKFSVTKTENETLLFNKQKS